MDPDIQKAFIDRANALLADHGLISAWLNTNVAVRNPIIFHLLSASTDCMFRRCASIVPSTKYSPALAV
jgi:hypothetical protein